MRESLVNESILCVSHIISVNGGNKNLNSSRAVLNSYHGIIETRFNKIQETIHTAYKDETQKTYDYSIFLYKPKPNYGYSNTNSDKLNIDKVDVVIPARDESETIGNIVSEIRLSKYVGDIIVVDNNSVDETSLNAISEGAKVVKCNQRGYGLALKKGISSSTN